MFTINEQLQFFLRQTWCRMLIAHLDGCPMLTLLTVSSMNPFISQGIRLFTRFLKSTTK